MLFQPLGPKLPHELLSLGTFVHVCQLSTSVNTIYNGKIDIIIVIV